MIEKLVAFEERLTRLEAALLVGVVVFMLFLAVYNVFYRNVLIPIQVSVVESATTEVEVPIEPEPEAEGSDTDESEEANDFGGGFGGGFGDAQESGDEAGGFGGGFGGGFDEGSDGSGETASADDEAGGFGGGFDSEPAEDVADEPEADRAGADTEDGAGGFGGGFGGGFEDEEPMESGDAEDDGFAGGFGGGFDGEADSPADETPEDVPEQPTTRIERRGPEEGSFAYTLAEFIDAVKLEWIDLVLRQLVLVVGFLGSMLATRRRKHITIDALSKILPMSGLPWVQVATNALSVVVCVFLALAGWDLVEIGLEFPKEVTAWAEEWMFQLTFPVGFGMLALHFGIRTLESVGWGITGEPVGTIELEERPVAASATAGQADVDSSEGIGVEVADDSDQADDIDDSHGEEE
jgi:TRAP-type C4-dicarboxylate transport system permease small subunit